MPSKKNYERYKAEGICPRCKGQNYGDKVLCSKCHENDRALCLERLHAGLCTKCGREREDEKYKLCRRCRRMNREKIARRGKERNNEIVKAWQKAHPEAVKRLQRQYQDKLRRSIILAYGVECQDCGQTIDAFLTVHHGGLVKPGPRSGNGFYRWLRKNGYPKGPTTVCWNCLWIRERHRRRQMASRTERAITQQRYRDRLRYEVINAYGGECRCCGERDLDVLTLDHVAGDGSDHRERVMGSRKAAGVTFYREMKKQGYPKGLRVLCWNCNTAVAKLGQCPHSD